MLINRPFWQSLIEDAWKKKNIIWLMGVRRVGKTSLCQSLENVEYYDCELPRVRQLLEDPEAFLTSKKGKRVILDEIHRLDNPSELLKIAADHYRDVKVVATGSSTLGASAKFKDTLTGRKKEIWLTPLLLQELAAFGNDLYHRFLFGGCPAFFEQTVLPEDDFKEWIEAYWAKDIQDMFRVGKRHSFQKFAELALAHSGGQFEISKYTVPCEATRQTIAHYLDVLEKTFIVNVIRPFSTHKPTEIVMAPKIYGFDTGFVCYAKGWRDIRKEDLGILWEHAVLNEIQGKMQTRSINYWRDKKGHEVDFIIPQKGDGNITAIECKFSILKNDLQKLSLKDLAKNFLVFRDHYPKGTNFIVASDINESFERTYEGLTLTFVNTEDLIKRLKRS